MSLLSVSVAVFSIYFSFGISKFHYSGVLSGLVADFFLDMFSINGCLIFLGASYIMLFRAYFDLDLHKPFLIIKEKVLIAIGKYKEARDQNFKEYEKRKHTNELKSKIRLDIDSLTQDKPVTKDILYFKLTFDYTNINVYLYFFILCLLAYTTKVCLN